MKVDSSSVTMKNPTISIIVPVYNTETYLTACLDSILVQTFSDWECVLVDDGSKDKSGEICDEYASRDNRFVVVHKQNEGVAKARITAFEHSHGGLITFIDSDDTVSPLYLEKLSRPILEDGADMVSCDYYKLENGVREELLPKLTGTYEGKRLKDFLSNHYFYERRINGYGMTPFLCTKMVRREFVYVGLNKGSVSMEDGAILNEDIFDTTDGSRLARFSAFHAQAIVASVDGAVDNKHTVAVADVDGITVLGIPRTAHGNAVDDDIRTVTGDRKSTRLNSSHL